MMEDFKVGEKVVVAIPIEVWRGKGNDIKPNINIDVGEEVTITNIFKHKDKHYSGLLIEIDRVDPKYGSFLPTYFKKLEKENG